MRLYVPATSILVEKLILDGEIPVTHGFAVTSALRDWYEADDEEELEYLAAAAAARQSMALLSLDQTAQRRRAVLALEVPTIVESTSADRDRSAVEVGPHIKMDQVDSILVDSIDAEADIVAALAVWEKSDEDAHFAREQAMSHELLWFARQEIPFIF